MTEKKKRSAAPAVPHIPREITSSIRTCACSVCRALLAAGSAPLHKRSRRGRPRLALGGTQ